MNINVTISNITYAGKMNAKGEKQFIFSFDKNIISGEETSVNFIKENTPWFSGMKNTKHLFVKTKSKILLEKGMNISIKFDKKHFSKDTKYNQYNIVNPEVSINHFISRDGFMRYLKTINGIGDVAAKKITEALEKEYDFQKSPMIEVFKKLVEEEVEILQQILKKKIVRVQEYLNLKEENFNNEKNESSLTEHEQVFGLKYGITDNVLLRIKKSIMKKINNKGKLTLNTTDVSAFLKYKPYYLAADPKFARLGFKTIDDISWKIRNDINNFGEDTFNDEEFKKQRFFGFINCVITEAYNNDGHMFLTLEECRERVKKENRLRENQEREELFIEVFDEQEEFNSYLFGILDRLSEEGANNFIIYDNGNFESITTEGIYNNELNLAKKVLGLNQNKPFVKGKDKKEIIEAIKNIEIKENITLSEEQRESVLNTLMSPLSVITGGPGTGKTTTSNIVIRTLEHFGANIKILAPTGTAANRVSAVSGFNASTIHRGLGSKGTGKWTFNEDSPLTEDIIIIDESSMIDVNLANRLISASMNSNIIFIGDINQLPSVGPGRFLGDLIESLKFCVSKLTKVFRQAQGNPIIQLAYAINSGDSKTPYKFFFSKPEEIKENKLSIVIKDSYKQPDKDNPDGLSDWEREELKSLGEYREAEKSQYMQYIINDSIDMAETYHHLENSLFDVQVLTNSNNAASKVNERLQQKLNPSGIQIPKSNGVSIASSVTVRVGDKVIHTKNNYKLDVFNGSIGRVVSYNHKTQGVDVLFTDGVNITYPVDVFAKEVRLNYCMTVHKSQGQEFKNVVMVSLWNPLSREILYTGATRAKEKLIIYTNEKILRTGIYLSGEDKLKRNTRLKEFLKDPLFLENFDRKNYQSKSNDYFIKSPSDKTNNDLKKEIEISMEESKTNQPKKSIEKNVEKKKVPGKKRLLDF